MSLKQYYDAKQLLRKGKLKILSDDGNMITYEAGGYSVIYDKRRERYSCTCKGSSAFLKGKFCYHILAIIMDKEET